MKKKPPRKPPQHPAPTGRAAPRAGAPIATVAMPGAKTAMEMKADAAIRDAMILFGQQEFRRAKILLDQVIAALPDYAPAYKLRSQVYSRGMLKADKAEADLRRAEAILGPDGETLRLLAELHLRRGDEAAAEQAARACLAAAPKSGEAYEILARLKSAALAEADQTAMAALAEDAAVPARARRALQNALARLAEKRGDYDAAFARFAAAGALAEGGYDGLADLAAPESVRRGFDADFQRDRRGWGLKEARNVFLIGMPRSGSTLVEQALTAHPRVESGGETNAMAQVERLLMERLKTAPKPSPRSFAFLSGLGKADLRIAANAYRPIVEPHFVEKNPAKILDKTLANFSRVPLILLLFPNATLIHTFRHPLDTALSCFQQNFASTNFASRLDWIAQYWRMYRLYMDVFEEIAPGRIIHLCHEDLVEEFEPRLRRLVALCGLEWDDRCARPEENDRLVYTASAAQVRAPVNRSAFGRWRRYEKHLGPLIEAMGGMEAIEAAHETFRARAAPQFSFPSAEEAR